MLGNYFDYRTSILNHRFTVLFNFPPNDPIFAQAKIFIQCWENLREEGEDEDDETFGDLVVFPEYQMRVTLDTEQLPDEFFRVYYKPIKFNDGLFEDPVVSTPYEPLAILSKNRIIDDTNNPMIIYEIVNPRNMY
jgi:hypothetical protein